MTGRLYLDTSALVKLYIAESGSEWLQQRCSGAEDLLLSPLQETELRNAILAAQGRKLLYSDVARQTIKHFETDLSEDCYTAIAPDWPIVWQRANQLAEAHTPTLLCRTLDILHVAIAEAAGADLLITGDDRQFKLCDAIELHAEKVPS